MEYILTHDLATDRRIPTLTLTAREERQVGRVIVLHGLGGSKEDYLEDLYRVAQAGFTAVAIDARLHGERRDAGERDTLLDGNFAQAMQQIVYGTAEDVSYLIDHWADEAPTGFIGISTGGFIGHVLATSGRRLTAMASVISSPDWLNVDPARVPPIESEAGQMLAAISPVNHPEKYLPLALLMVNGEADETVLPIGSVTLSERLQPLYKAAGMADKLTLGLYPGLGHVYLPQMRDMAVQWMRKFLTENSV